MANLEDRLINTLRQNLALAQALGDRDAELKVWIDLQNVLRSRALSDLAALDGETM